MCRVIIYPSQIVGARASAAADLSTPEFWAVSSFRSKHTIQQMCFRCQFVGKPRLRLCQPVRARLQDCCQLLHCTRGSVVDCDFQLSPADLNSVLGMAVVCQHVCVPNQKVCCLAVGDAERQQGRRAAARKPGCMPFSPRAMNNPERHPHCRCKNGLPLISSRWHGSLKLGTTLHLDPGLQPADARLALAEFVARGSCLLP